MSDNDTTEVEQVRAAMGIGTKYVTVATFAKATGLCERTINNMFTRGILHRRRLGATVYVDIEEAAAALAAGKYSPRPDKPSEPERRRPGRPVGSTKKLAAAQRAAAAAVRASGL